MTGSIHDVVREDLLRRLPAADGDEQLVVVAAPAGWGKTTMLGSWDRWSTGTEFCWCSLTPADNDTTRFIGRLTETARPLVGGQQLAEPGESTPMVWVEQALPLFVEALSASGPTAIVLDDYHHIDNADTHGVVQSLIDSVGPETLVVLSSRTDPPLKLSRLRAARAVTEIRSDDLRFDQPEAEQLLQRNFELTLDTEQLQLLVEATEGWPAAISLAAQSLRTVNDPEEFLARFVGSDRLITDYLAEELLDTLPPSHQSFLGDTSVVEMFVPDLASALTTAIEGQPSVGEIGEDLERHGLVSRHYDSNRVWFRYHQLLRDVVYRRLDTETRQARHLAAAEWFVANDHPRSAIEQLIAAGEGQRAAALIERHAADYILRGRLKTVMDWIAEVARIGHAHPGLFLLGAQAALYGGRIDLGKAWLADAEAGPKLSIGEQTLALHVHTILATAEGRMTDAAQIAERLTELYEANGGEIDLAPRDLAECLVIAGTSLSVTGETERSERWLDEGLAIATKADNQAPALVALGMKSLHTYLEGDIPATRALVKRAFGIAAAMDLPPTAIHMAIPLMTQVLIGTQCEAREAIEHQRQISEYTYSLTGIATGNICEAHFWIEIGDHDAAERALVAARDVLDELRQPAPLVEHYFQVIKDRQPTTDANEEPAGPEALTDRELQVLRAFSSNLTQREIGRELFLSFNTIKTYSRSAYRKLGVGSRSEAVRACRQAGLF